VSKPYQALPIVCRRCADRESKSVQMDWTHECLKGKPMREGCEWMRPRHPNFQETKDARTSH